jgi:dethiobiotin synthetase
MYMNRPLFITGIGTGIGKTVISAIVTEALEADYWKPIQAGFEDGTDSERVSSLLSNAHSRIMPETYKLAMPASPHIAAREENIFISLPAIAQQFRSLDSRRPLVIEGAGGLMVPLNETAFVADLAKLLNARLILVSRNYLGSINHSLLTAAACKAQGLEVLGWIFNDQYLDYETEIAAWSNHPRLASVPAAQTVDREFILQQANKWRPVLKKLL